MLRLVYIAVGFQLGILWMFAADALVDRAARKRAQTKREDKEDT